MNGSAPPLDLDPNRTAFFLDCDGTLAEIVAQPSLARVEPAVLESVRALYECTGGAVAVISGRSLAQLDALLHPLILPLAGIHGLERRDAGRHVHKPEIDEAALANAVAAVQTFASRNPGLICEPKPGSVALHYRMRPELEAAALELAAATAVSIPSLRLLHGKSVVELRLGDRTKGDAIRDFMREPPFAGRLPVFVGDDETDETGFRALAGMGGIGIKIGAGRTAAGWRVGTPAGFHAWLAQLAAAWRSERSAAQPL